MWPRWPLYLALLIGLAGAVFLVRAGLVTSDTGTPSPSPVARTADERRDLLQKSLRAIEDGERESPRDRWDPEYVVATVGRDPHQLADWVRTYTYWIPYRGQLRGATGVLMDGQGNSLDRAVLLATLLQKAGHTVRLAHRELSRDQALELMPALARRRTEAFRPAPAAALIRADDLRQAADHYTLDAAAIDTNAPQESLQRAAAEARARVADQSGRLLRSVPRPEAPSDWGRRFRAAVEAMRDHWWVQRADGGRWVDIDVTDPDDRSHTPITGDGEPIALEAAPEDGRSHELTVRVIAERWSPRGLSERRALEHVVRPHEIFGQPLVLQFWPMDALPSAPAPSSNSAAPPESWGILLLTGASVSATGLVQASGDDPDAQDTGAFGGFASAFGNLAGGTRSKEDAASALSAVWIEYEIRAPGMRPETIRRAVFDLIGPDARAASAAPALAIDDAKARVRQAGMSMRTEILPIVCRIAPEFVAHLAAQMLLGNRHLLEAVAGNAEAAAIADRVAQPAAPTVSGLYALALARTAWSRRPGILFDERITLFTKHVYRAVSGGRPVVFEATDIVSSRSGVDLDERDGFAARLEQGVLDTNAESLIHLDQPVTGNAGTAYKASASWTPVDGADAVHRLPLPPDIRRRIQQDLAAGYVVVAPAAAIPDGTGTFTGWWRIDPETGDTLGFGPHGWGESQLGERGVQHTGSRPGMIMLRKMGVQFATVFTVSYLWCVAAMTEPKLETEGFKLGVLRATLVASPSECLGDSLAYGVFAAVTVPLLALAVEGSVIATRPPRVPQRPGGAAPPKAVNPPEPPPPPKPECPGGASPKATTSQTPASPPLPEFPPEEATVSPQANSMEMPAQPAAAAPEGGNPASAAPSTGGSGPAPPRGRYAPWWDGPLSPAEFQEYQEWVEYNRAQAEKEASAARGRYRAATDALEQAQAASEAADAAYQEAKAANPNSPESQEAWARRTDAQRAQSRAETEAFKADQEFSRKSTDYSKAQKKSAYSKRIAEANRKLYEARQAYNRAIQKFNEYRNANPTSTCADSGYDQQLREWSQADAAWNAAQSEFYKDAMFGQEPPSPMAENPTVPAEAPGPGAPAASPVPASPVVDPALDKTAPQPAAPDPALDKTQPQTAPSVSPLATTQPQAAPPISPLAKTLSGASGVSSAIKSGGQ